MEKILIIDTIFFINWLLGTFYALCKLHYINNNCDDNHNNRLNNIIIYQIFTLLHLLLIIVVNKCYHAYT